MVINDSLEKMPVLKIIYKIEEHHSMIARVRSAINFKHGYADFDIEDGHQHIPVENIISISQVYISPLDKASFNKKDSHIYG